MIDVQQQASAHVYSAYKYTVRTCLMRFYAKTETEAEELVQVWWDRMRSLDDGYEDLFLHAEAITTAADLAKSADVPVTSESQAIYDAILEDADRWTCANRAEEFTLPQRVA